MDMRALQAILSGVLCISLAAIVLGVSNFLELLSVAYYSPQVRER